MDEHTHHSILEHSYNKVGLSTWANKDFDMESLEASRKLFTKDSLQKGKPEPKKLEVYGLLSGLPFEDSFSTKLVNMQNKIDKVLDGSLRYWVLQENFGLEYCVFKWPDCEWKEEWEKQIYSYPLKKKKSFKFDIYGIQINPDGCVIAKGFDEGSVIPNLRQELKEGLNFLPEKQSGWAHVPMGRILEPIGEAKFTKLLELIKELSNVHIASCQIDTIKFVHETQWYMEERDILKEFNLCGPDEK